MAENYALVGFKEIGRNIGGFCHQNKAHILTGLSVAGTLGCGVLSVRAGARSARKIDRREEELGRRLTPGEKMKLCGTDFIAPVASGVVAICGSIGSDVINTQTIARTNMALIASEKAYEALNRKTKEVLGEKKARQIKDEIVKEKAKEIEPMILSQNAFDHAPRTGEGAQYPYVDGYSTLPFWSNPDYLKCSLMKLQEMMRELKPRGDEFDYYDKIVGVAYSEWLSLIGYDRKVWDTPERRNAGWNKGFAVNGEDDDPIEYYMTPIEYSPGFAVTMLTWEKDPTDMKLGRLLKSNGM